MTDVLDLIRADAAGEADHSGKTALDSQIELWRAADNVAVENSLTQALKQLDQNDWKQWRAFRQIVWKVGLRAQALRDALGVVTEVGNPSNPHARFYAYLARSDLGNPASMEELLADTTLRDERPSDWLQLAFNQLSPQALHSEYLKLATKLSPIDFTFSLARLREKYGENFINWMAELCRAMSFDRASDLATQIDEEYSCGIYSEILATHPSLKGRKPPPPSHNVTSLWEGFDPAFRNRVAEKMT